jgi:hypothetical protein
MPVLEPLEINNMSMGGWMEFAAEDIAHSSFAFVPVFVF